MRFDLPAPDLSPTPTPADGRIPWTDLVEPRYVVPVPDLHSASREAIAPPAPIAQVSPSPVHASRPQPWPAPTLADAAPVVVAFPARTNSSSRWAVGLVAAAGAVAVGAAALVALF